MTLDLTHDPRARSWVPSAADPEGDFPLQNLPHGVFRRLGRGEPWRGGVAIGRDLLDLQEALARGAFQAFDGATQAAARAAAEPTLNGLMALGRPAWRALRRALWQLLHADSAQVHTLAGCLVAQDAAQLRLPAAVGDYTDFFTSHDHMRRMGQLFQPERPLLPQFSALPIAYHGRASTVEASPSELPRPWGQYRAPGEAHPVVAPTRALDFELELAAWIGSGNVRGTSIALAQAEDHLFGLSLLNDWSARDVQGFEAVPLGPFQAKNFLSTVSPWIVTWEALAPYRCAVRRDAGDPPLQPYLQPPPGLSLGLDLRLQAWLQPLDGPARLLTDTRSSHGHWSFAQMLVQHALNGCALRPGDLIGSGTQSGPGPTGCGCLMERAAEGQPQPGLLHDGDSVLLRAWGQADGAARIGFGDCRGTVRAARPGPA